MTQTNSMNVDARFVEAIVKASSGSPKVLMEEVDRFHQDFPEDEPITDYFKTLFAGVKNYWSGRCDDAIPQFESLMVSEVKVRQDIRGLVHMMAGGNWRSVGQFEKAVSNLLKAREMINPESELATYAGYARYQLGEIHLHLEDFEEAELYFTEAVDISVAAGNKNAEFRSRSGLGGLLVNNGKLDEAQTQLELAIDMATAAGQKGRVLHDLAGLAEAREDYQKAEVLALEAYNLRKENSLFDAASTSQILMARSQLNQGNKEAAVQNLNEALEVTKKYVAVAKEMEVYRLLSLAHEKTGEFEKAFSFLKQHSEISQSLNTDQQREIYKLKNARIREQKKEIEEAHTEIQDSIAYAKRIQSAILPPLRLVEEHLPNSFILYKPKDVVAGDFYWMETKEDKVLIAAADCTGHGVPGAMVSVICNGGLNRSVNEFGLTEPGQILDKTRELVIQEFEKSEEEVKDGMDIALCALTAGPSSPINPDAEAEQSEETRSARIDSSGSATLQYAGAHNALWIVRQGAEEVEEIKADKQPIGKYAEEKPFTTHSVELNEGDTFYLFSDGYADQFGGERGKKFKAANFKRLLISIQDKSMDDQMSAIDEAFEDWRGDQEQVDDVVVIGIRVS